MCDKSKHCDVEYEVTRQFFKLKASQSQTVCDRNVILNFVVKEEKHVDMYIFINIVGLVLLYTSHCDVVYEVTRQFFKLKTS